MKPITKKELLEVEAIVKQLIGKYDTDVRTKIASNTNLSQDVQQLYQQALAIKRDLEK